MVYGSDLFFRTEAIILPVAMSIRSKSHSLRISLNERSCLSPGHISPWRQETIDSMVDIEREMINIKAPGRK